MTESNDAATGRMRKRQAVKTAGEQTTKKLKTTFHLSREADQRLNIHCAMMGVDRSALVERLINENLKRYVVSDRGKPASDEEVAA